jgi:cation diffusion facilitator CzcD-associated flavoprotein CzcO
MPRHKPCDVIVVGAGAAGIGVGVVLKELGLRFKILERHEVGASFARWPREMRFITPSFPSNQFGALDLNSVAIGTSPAFSLGCEHPTGREYAAYLKAVAEHFELPVETGVDVQTVAAVGEDGFVIGTSTDAYRSRFVIWAAGEFQYPRLSPFPGAELCRHNAQVSSWRELEGDDFLIVGGYESGVDAAIHLANAGKKVRILDRDAAWLRQDSDPSVTLSPFTRERLDAALATKRIRAEDQAEVIAVEQIRKGLRTRFELRTREGKSYASATPPILATGFLGSVRLLHDLFTWREDGLPELTEQDESTLIPGLFLSGPSVRQNQVIFCFIYKFRQRFAVVAQAIAERIGISASPLENYRKQGMFLDDLSCCGEECVC